MPAKKIISPNSKVNINRQCQLLGLSSTAFYYNPKPVIKMDLSLMRVIDEIHLEPHGKSATACRTFYLLDNFNIAVTILTLNF